MEKNIEYKPFNIGWRKAIERGEYKVETRSGKSVRIICWDAKNPRNEGDIVALVSGESGSENILRYYSDGRLISDSAGRGTQDLVICVPIPRYKKGDTVKIVWGSYLNSVFKEEEKAPVDDGKYKIIDVRKISLSSWIYSVVKLADGDPNKTYLLGDEDEKYMELCPEYNAFEKVLVEIIESCTQKTLTEQDVRLYANKILHAAALWTGYTKTPVRRKIKDVTTKRTEDGDCVTTETLLVKGWIDDDDFRIIKPNCMVNKEMLCIPVKELYNELPHD